LSAAGVAGLPDLVQYRHEYAGIQPVHLCGPARPQLAEAFLQAGHTIGCLRRKLEARVGIGRLKHRFRDKNTHFCWLHKLNTATTRTSTMRTPLMTFFADSASDDSTQFNEQKESNPRECSPKECPCHQSFYFRRDVGSQSCAPSRNNA